MCRYFHKIPAEPPQLELKASYGLAEPVTFELPPLSEQCSPEVYATFDLTKGAKNEKVLRFVPRLGSVKLTVVCGGVSTLGVSILGLMVNICVCEEGVGNIYRLPPAVINICDCFTTLIFRPNPRRRR